jgi:hypothetical protein
MDLNIYVFVGMIMLIGIVEKNAIMQIDFALEAERTGMTAEEAIYQGCLIRFRPIMMTTMAALLGAVPMALGFGVGGEARQPLGLVVVGGLGFSQLVTLYLTRWCTRIRRVCRPGCRAVQRAETRYLSPQDSLGGALRAHPTHTTQKPSSTANLKMRGLRFCARA